MNATARDPRARISSLDRWWSPEACGHGRHSGFHTRWDGIEQCKTVQLAPPVSRYNTTVRGTVEYIQMGCIVSSGVIDYKSNNLELHL
jgi:hypothetical protein